MIIDDEEKQLRNLDKLYMIHIYLNEDHAMTKNSLKEAQKIRDESKKEMNEFDIKSNNEIEELDNQVKEMEKLIIEHEQIQKKNKNDINTLQNVI